MRKYGCVKICRTFTRACSQVNELVTGAISEAIAAEKKGALQSKKDDISIGQRVKARFSDGEWYKGTIDDIDLAATDWETTRVHIRFDDGDESWSDFPSESLRIEEQQPEQKQQLKTRAEAGDQHDQPCSAPQHDRLASLRRLQARACACFIILSTDSTVQNVFI